MSISNRTCFQVNLRDCLRCRVCGREPCEQATYHRGFEYHHVQPRSENGSDEADNLILLCHDCHTLHHQGKLSLPQFDDLRPPAIFGCRNCGRELQTATVEMNCGWYRCERCQQKTHLWQHCGYENVSNRKGTEEI